MFKRFEGETCILISGGVYKIADVYRYIRPMSDGDVNVFAAYGSGYVMLRRNGITSKDKLIWRDLSLTHHVYDTFGKMIYQS